MTEEQKQYIENNIDLIEYNEWETFFHNAPEGIGGVLYEAGIDFMTVLGYVPSRAFAGCSNITSITIPDNVTSIESFAFLGCSNLKNIDLGTGVRSIGITAFSRCSSLKNITIPKGITELSENMFFLCSNLTQVVIPNSMNHIKVGVFTDCPNLFEIIFNGTKREFRNIKKSKGWTDDSIAIRCSDGDFISK